MNPPCLICSSDTYALVDKSGRLFHFCHYCQFVSLDQKFHLSFEAERERYDLHDNRSDNEGYRQWLSNFASEAVIPYISLNSRILDFGCGPNPLMKVLLEEKGYSVEVYDKHFHDYPFKGKFDMIISTEVIEHIEYPAIQVQELKSHLNPQGHLSLKTAFRPTTDESFLNWWYKEDKTHISFFSPEAMIYMASQSQLSITHCDDKSVIILKN